MSKIFEALEHSRRNEPEDEYKESPVSQSSVSLAPIEASTMDFENEMITLNQAVAALLPNVQKKIIQFIGARQGEGVSTIAREFALTAANTLGQSVLLIDANYRNPVQHSFLGIKFFKIEAEHDCGDGLDNRLTDEKAMYQVGDSKLFLYPTFPLFSLASQGGSSSKIKDFFEKLKLRFDLILIDSPPMTGSPESIALCKSVDGFILVCEADKTRWPVIENVKDRIIKNGGNILGVVFNKRRYYIPDSIYRNL